MFLCLDGLLYQPLKCSLDKKQRKEKYAWEIMKHHILFMVWNYKKIKFLYYSQIYVPLITVVLSGLIFVLEAKNIKSVISRTDVFSKQEMGNWSVVFYRKKILNIKCFLFRSSVFCHCFANHSALV